MKRWTKQEKAGWTRYKRMYHEAIKGHKFEYRKRFTKSEFREWYRNVKLAPGLGDHPIRNMIKAQEISDNKTFTKAAKKRLGGKLTKQFREDPEFRKQLFRDYVDELKAQGMTQDEARKAAEDYYGY